MTPSWYDVLGVEPDASTAEIRAAWKAGVADLDPTDRRFRSLNKAAEVLLDEDRRRAHDAVLAAELDAEEAADAVHTADTGTAAEAQEAGRAGDTASPAVSGSSEPDVAVPVSRGPRRPGAEAEGARPRRAVVLTAVLGLVAAVLLVVAVVSVTTDSVGPAAASSDSLPDAREVAAARAAAEAAVVPVLSYDFRELEQGKQAALSYMTPDYAAEYEQLFESVIAVNAPSTETVVDVEVLASGIVRTGPDLVDVLLFVNRPTVNREQTTPEIYKDQATLRMRQVGGDWLVDCVISGAGSTCE